MPLSCCAPGCRTGYKKEPPDPEVSIHKFPDKEKNRDLHEKWLKAIPRAN